MVTSPIKNHCTYCGARPDEQCVDNWGFAVEGGHANRCLPDSPERVQEAEQARAQGQRPRKVTLMDIHGALSCLLHAAQTEFLGHLIQISYNPYTYLQLEVEVSTQAQSDRVALILQRGIIHGPYDYRFRSVAVPLGYDDHERRMITASLDLCHERRPPEE